MDLGPDRFTAIADDPVGRLLRVAAAAVSPREQRDPAVVPVHDRADVHRIRLDVADARRRLERTRDDLLQLSSAARTAGASGTSVVPGDETSPAATPVTYARRAYAPPALGRVDHDGASTPPPPRSVAQVVDLTSTLQVTNLGTLLDVLA